MARRASTTGRRTVVVAIVLLAAAGAGAGVAAGAGTGSGPAAGTGAEGGPGGGVAAGDAPGGPALAPRLASTSGLAATTAPAPPPAAVADRPAIRLGSGGPVVPGVPHRVADDIAYGPLPDQVLDVYRSTEPATTPAGAIVYVHGGAWIGGDEDLMSHPFPQLIKDLTANEGWTVISVRYRLADDPSVAGDVGTPFPAALLDVNRAVRWVKANAAELGVDPAHVVVYGWSAGGHLATMLGTTWNVPALQPTDLPADLAAMSPRPAAVVSIAAPLDPGAWGDSNPDPANVFSPTAAIASFAGCAGPHHTSCTADQLRRVDATTHADRADPAMYIGHGDRDGIVLPASQTAATMRLGAELGSGRLVYDVTDAGPDEHRSHVPDMALDGAALRSFLAAA
jgi:acetyl esterase/lipase